MPPEPLELIQFDQRGDVVVVRLNRPPANAMDPRLLDELNAPAVDVRGRSVDTEEPESRPARQRKQPPSRR